MLYVRGDKIKTRHDKQDRSSICAICMAKGHFRTDCPDLQVMKELMEKDRAPDDPEPSEVKSGKKRGSS